VLGGQDRGFYQIMDAFQLERVVLAAMGLGHAAEAITLVTEYVRGREVAGAPLSGLQTIRHRVAAMEIELDAARALTYQAADRLDRAYRFLRTVEHRLQLYDEQQTHLIPSDEQARVRLARVLVYRDSPERTALERFAAGTFALMFPTIKHLERLHQYSSVEALLAYARTKPIVTVMPTVAPDAKRVLDGSVMSGW